MSIVSILRSSFCLVGAILAFAISTHLRAEPDAPKKPEPQVETLTVMPKAEVTGANNTSLHPLPTTPNVPPVIPELPEDQRVLVDRDLEWFRKVEDPGKIRSEDENPGEYQAYSYLISFASKLDPKLMGKYSNPKVPYANLVHDIRQDYYLDLLHFEGRLRMLTSMKPTKLSQNSGVKTVYEGWLFPAKVYNPICILLTELPPGIEADQPINKWVKFDGYSFKLMQYESGEMKGNGRYQWRIAPLLIGKTFEVIPEPGLDEDARTFSTSFVALVAGGLTAFVVIAIIIALWFVRSDRRIRSKLANVTQPEANPFGDTKPLSE